MKAVAAMSAGKSRALRRCVVLAAILSLAGCADKQMSRVHIGREVLVPSPSGGVMRTGSVLALRDGGFLVTGSSANLDEALAVKVDAAGKMVWWRRRPLFPDIKDPVSERRRGRALDGSVEYTSAAEAPDGRVFLCGTRVRYDDGVLNNAGVVDQLDVNGHLVSERDVRPLGVDGRRFNWIKSCIFYDNSLIIFGFEQEVKDSLIWISRIGPGNNVLWQKIFPTNPISKTTDSTAPEPKDLKWNPDDEPVQGLSAKVFVQREADNISGESFTFIADDNNNSELVRVSPSGDILAALAVRGRARFVRTTSDAGKASIYVSTSRGIPDAYRSTFGRDARNAALQPIYLKPLAYVSEAFFIDDGAMLFFGVDGYEDHPIHPAVSVVGDGMIFVSRKRIAPSGDAYVIGGPVVARGADPNVFMLAMPSEQSGAGADATAHPQAVASGLALFPIHVTDGAGHAAR